MTLSKVRPSGLDAIFVTLISCATGTPRGIPVSASQRLSMPSRPRVVNSLLSGRYHNRSTGTACRSSSPSTKPVAGSMRRTTRS